MDTTKEYIKMCDCEEIQNLLIPADGDFCWPDDGGAEYLGYVEFPAMTAVVHIATGNSKNYWHNWLWLPRQDDLQKMMDYPAIEVLIDKFYYWARREHNISPLLTSMEQLWLAYVMSERHRKVWSGKEWG